MAEHANKNPHPICNPGTAFGWSDYLTRLLALAAAPLLGALLASVLSPAKTPEYLSKGDGTAPPVTQQREPADPQPASGGVSGESPEVKPIPAGANAVPDDLGVANILGSGSELSPAGVQALLAQGAASLVDARSAEEFERSHVKGAINLRPDASPGAFDAIRIARLTNSPKTVIVYGDDPAVLDLVADRLSKAGVSRAIRTWRTSADQWTEAKVAAESGSDVDAMVADALTKSELGLHEAYLLHELDVAAFVDARERETFLEGHVDRAWNLSPTMANSPAQAKRVGDLLQLLMEEQRPIVVYCIGHDCTDARDIAARLRSIGITGVHVMTAAYAEWADAGFPVSTEDDDEMLRMLFPGGE